MGERTRGVTKGDRIKKKFKLRVQVVRSLTPQELTQAPGAHPFSLSCGITAYDGTCTC